MKILIVGGDWCDKNPRSSGLIEKLGLYLSASGSVTIYNGGSLSDLKVCADSISSSDYNLIFWMPNIDNREVDVTFKKPQGSVCIVSKVIRETRTRVDAVARIFKFHGNAVIAITSNNGIFNLELIDALDNTWYSGENLESFCEKVGELYGWTKGAIRVNTKKYVDRDVEKLIAINKEVATKNSQQNIRYFGNLSTRCMKMFPTMRGCDQRYLVSPRNIDKKYITPEDMVEVWKESGEIVYKGGRKPSVDLPIQIAIYERFPQINYMIHGHSFVEGALQTDHYYPCGDMREVEEVCSKISEAKESFGVVNLKNHGFFIYSDRLENLDKMVKTSTFKRGGAN